MNMPIAKGEKPCLTELISNILVVVCVQVTQGMLNLCVILQAL